MAWALFMEIRKTYVQRMKRTHCKSCLWLSMYSHMSRGCTFFLIEAYMNVSGRKKLRIVAPFDSSPSSVIYAP